MDGILLIVSFHHHLWFKVFRCHLQLAQDQHQPKHSAQEMLRVPQPMRCMLCFSEMEPEWTYLHCRTCLFRACQVPPPKATKIGPHIPGRLQLLGNYEDTSTEGKEDDTDQMLEELRRLAPEGNVDEFMLWVDGSGGENEWGVGMLDARDEKTQQCAG